MDLSIADWLGIPKEDLDSLSDQKESWIYFIRSKDAGLVKIGVTGNLQRRFSALQCSSPVDLEIVFAFVGPRCVEKLLHRRFSEFRVRHEWFKYCAPIIDLIENARKGHRQEDIDCTDGEEPVSQVGTLYQAYRVVNA